MFMSNLKRERDEKRQIDELSVVVVVKVIYQNVPQSTQNLLQLWKWKITKYEEKEREEAVKESNNIRFLPEHSNFKMIAYTWLNIQHDGGKLRNENKDTMKKKNLMQSHVYVNMCSKLTEWLTGWVNKKKL